MGRCHKTKYEETVILHKMNTNKAPGACLTIVIQSSPPTMYSNSPASFPVFPVRKQEFSGPRHTYLQKWRLKRGNHQIGSPFKKPPKFFCLPNDLQFRRLRFKWGEGSVPPKRSEPPTPLHTGGVPKEG